MSISIIRNIKILKTEQKEEKNKMRKVGCEKIENRWNRKIERIKKGNVQRQKIDENKN